jgi:hypothetical protein
MLHEAEVALAQGMTIGAIVYGQGGSQVVAANRCKNSL